MEKKYEFLGVDQKNAVDKANETSSDLFMMVDGFQTLPEALMLRDMLWYARDNGVQVVFVAKQPSAV